MIGLDEYERLAREQMCERGQVDLYDYYAGGSEREITLRANLAAFERICLRPRLVTKDSEIQLETTVLGIPVSMPVLIAPTAYAGLGHYDGELAIARGADQAGTLMVSSINASYQLEDIAQVGTGPLWQQLYLYPDEAYTKALLARIEAAGYQALVLTIDRSRSGKRERDLRNGFQIAPSAAVNFLGTGVSPRTAPSPTSWEAIEWLRAQTRLPLVLKGVLTAEDAHRALEYGIDALIVSNHGGRQLDGALPSIEALPEVSEAVAGRCEVYLDGGVRRGTDVLKALALGARAVLIGRPILWGLVVDGQAGVYNVLEVLRAELALAMVLSGRPTLQALDRSLITYR